MKSNLLVSSLALAALLAGCTAMPESKKIDYKSASTAKLPSLEVPPDLVAPNRDERFSVPDVGGIKSGASYSQYAAERAGAARTSTAQEILPDAGKLRIERSGTQRWLVVPTPPDKLWGSVKEFWQTVGFVINIERPEAGVMETDWAENRAKIPDGGLRSLLGGALDAIYSTAERDKFRTRLEPGSEPGTTEIYISHRGMYEVYVTEGKDQTRWQPREVDPELEAEMLRRMMVRFGADETRAKTAVATATAVPDRARLQGRAGEAGATLEVSEPFDRAWRRVGLALDRVGFTVEDRDRSRGLYFVRYVNPEAEMKAKGDEPGFFSKLLFWRDTTKPTPESQYRILVKSASADASQVQVLSREGGTDTSENSRKIMNLLLEQLK